MKTLIKFKQFIDEINKENSRTYKLSILERYKNDEDIKYYLKFVFDPFIITGISDKKLNKDLKLPCYYDEKFINVKDVFEYLKIHNTGRDYDIQQIQSYKALELPVDLWDVYESIVTKNLQLGIDTKTINKVIPGLIFEFNVQLANKYFDKPEAVEGKEFAITTKIDGMRCIMLKENGNITFWSRQGQQIEGLVDLEEEAKQIKDDNFILDCELVADTALTETYKQTMQKARTKEIEKHGLKLKVFDWLPLEDFKNQRSNIPYSERRKKLEELFK